MKLIDCKCYGNVVRLFFGDDSCTDYHGDDWDDPSNDPVYDEYVVKTVDVAFDLSHAVVDPFSDINDITVFKNDMKVRKLPCFVVVPVQHVWEISYQLFAEAIMDSNCVRFYMEDTYTDVMDAIHSVGGLVFEKSML